MVIVISPFLVERNGARLLTKLIGFADKCTRALDLRYDCFLILASVWHMTAEP
jgi:hypothetical protein